jgi:hypothetical protein
MKSAAIQTMKVHEDCSSDEEQESKQFGEVKSGSFGGIGFHHIPAPAQQSLQMPPLKLIRGARCKGGGRGRWRCSKGAFTPGVRDSCVESPNTKLLI